MKYTITISILLFFTLCVKAQEFAKIDSKLIEMINTTENEYFDIYLHLSDRVNIYSILEEMRSERLSIDDRARHVVTSLRNKAENTQEDLIKALLRKKDLLYTESIRSLWITNAIQLTAHKDLIYEISTWESIEKIYTHIEGHTTVEEKVELSCSEDRAITNGIKAINAPAMWNLGYTGYGRKAFVMDSGVQIDHPALKTQYAGNNLPFQQAWTGGGTEPFDVGGHGTHVTGTILGLDRKTQDTIGVAFNANWIGAPVQFSNSPPQPHFVRSFVDNMQFALDPDGDPQTTDDIPDVFNNSWGHNNFSFEFCNPSAFFSEAHLALEAAGVAMVWSAGNNGDGVMSVTGYMNSNFDLVSSFAVGNVAQTAPFGIATSSSRGPSQCGGEGSLAIKPEVSAPGINVRSSYLNGGYAQLTGTSMSAPHVSGAILLLKEAFPYLSGDILLMALYLSAIDLGEPGEDNDYGMGLIDVFAAFNYLISEGYTPVPPVSNNLDLVLNNVDIPKKQLCFGENNFVIEFSNNGTDTIFSFLIEYGLEDFPSTTKNLNWTGILPPGTTQLLMIDSFQLTSSGTYNLTVSLSNPNNQADLRDLNNKQQRLFSVSPFEFLHIESDYIPCIGGEISLSADNISQVDNLIEWYSDQNLTNLLGEGTSLSLPNSILNQKVYVLQSLTGSVGETLQSTNNVTFDDLDNAGLFFNAYEDFTLKSVKVKTNDSGNIFFQILNSNNVPLISKVYRIEEIGINTIELELFIPEGYNYKFNIINGRILGSSSQNVQFPYILNNYVEIFASYDENNFFYTDKYNYFFDWDISKATCNATEYIIPVDETNPAPDLKINKSVDTLFLTNPTNINFSLTSNSPGIAFWDFGNGENSTEFEPTTTYTEEGMYEIILKMIFDTTCTVYAYENILVIDDRTSAATIFEEDKVYIYPNPFNNIINIESKFTGELDLHITNSVGQNVFNENISISENGSYQIYTTSLPPGSYFLYLSGSKTKSVYKIIKL